MIPSLVFFCIRCNARLISCVLVQQFLHDEYVHNSHKCMEINSIQQLSILVTTLKRAVFLLFNFSFQTTFPYTTSLVSTIFITMHRIQYLRSYKYICGATQKFRKFDH